MGELHKYTWAGMQRRAYELAKARGMWPEGEPAALQTAAKLALIHSAVAKATEAARQCNPRFYNLGTADWFEPEDDCPADERLPEFTAFEIALADVVIHIMDLAEARSCRLRDAVIAKMAFDESRSIHNGGGGGEEF